MSKKSILWILLDLIFLAVFNAIFFVAIETKQPASVWISYGFIHFSYLMVIATPLLIRKSSSASVFGFSLYSISATYFFIEFVLGVIFILIKPESYKFTLIVQIIIAAIYLIMLISHMIANEATADSIERQEAEVAYIRKATARVKPLVNAVNDKKAKKAVERAYDVLRSSPTRTDMSVYGLETEAMNKLEDLEDAVAAQNVDAIITVAMEIVSLMDERNRKLKILN